MNRKDIHTKAMYETLLNLKKKIDSDRERNIPKTLLSTGYKNLINKIIDDDGDDDIRYSEVLNAYLDLGKIEELLDILKRRRRRSSGFDYVKFMREIINRNSRELAYNYLDYIRETGTVLNCLICFLPILWEQRKFLLAEEIISRYLPKDQTGIFLILNDIKQGKPLSPDRVATDAKSFCEAPNEGVDEGYSYKSRLNNIMSFFIKGLEESGTDIPSLKTAVLVHKEFTKKGNLIGSLSNDYEIDKKIREYHFSRGEWTEAEEFMDLGSLKNYYQRDLLDSKIKYAIKNKDSRLHETALKELIVILDQDITSTKEKLKKDDLDSDWEKRSWYFRTKALKAAELACFEIIFGDETKAQEHIFEMIENTESIMTSIPAGCSKRNRGHIRGKVKVPFKRDLKILFLERGLFNHLPAIKGWNHPVKDPARRKEDRSAYEKQRDQKRIEKNISYQKSILKSEADLTYLFKMMLDENQTEEAIRYIEENSFSKDRADWERGMLILDHSKDSFHKLFTILSEGYFRRGHHDHNDYDAMAQFFVKGHILGVVTDSDWKGMVEKINNARFTEDGMGSIPSDAVRSIVRYTIAAGDIDRAWDFFKRILVIYKFQYNRGYCEKGNTTTISACLTYFIESTFNHESRDGKHLAFIDADIRKEKNVSKIDRIRYWDTIANINSHDNRRYRQSLRRLRENLLTSSDRHKAIKTWCKEMVRYSLRQPEQAKKELVYILDSELGKSDEIRRRVVYAMIEMKIPVMDIIDDLKVRETNPELHVGFLKKMAQKGYLDYEGLLRLLNRDRGHAPYLMRLLCEHPQEINLVIQEISKSDESLRIRWDMPIEVQVEKQKKLFQLSSWKKIFDSLEAFNGYELDYRCLIANLDEITKHPKGLYFGYFSVALKKGITVEKKDEKKFPVTLKNFLDLMDDDDVLMTFPKDGSFKPQGSVPMSKRWFLEKPFRKKYLKPENMKTFMKFGTVISLGIMEGSRDVPHLKKFYSYIFNNISPEVSRSSILQLGELFNLILKRDSYQMFDKLVEKEVPIGEEFRSFMEEHRISEKGRTILTLMIAREINLSFSIFKDADGKNKVDSADVKEMLMRVYHKLIRYKEIVDKYKIVPIRTSIGIEYEVTRSIAAGYKELTGSDYKNDIEILSEYSGISRGMDAVHEIATKPTDNPYLLLLELKLLEDLDFLDLNFKKEDYKRGARGLHVSVGGEDGVPDDRDSQFINNILLAGNLGGLNAGKDIVRGGGVRDRTYDSENVFGNGSMTPCQEFRSFSIDKSEPFERLIISLFNLCMSKQAADRYFKAVQEIGDPRVPQSIIKEKINNEIVYDLALEFFDTRKKIIELIKEHNKDFIRNETFDLMEGSSLSKLLMLFSSTGPINGIMEETGVNIHYMKELSEAPVTTEDVFFRKLEKDKGMKDLTERKKRILYLEYSLRIRPALERMQRENPDIYEKIEEYLNGNIQETIRKITNSKRFKEVIGDDKEYLEKILIEPEDMFKNMTAELINRFARINNLFIKRDSANALSMFDTTKEEDGTVISDSRLTESMIFDKLDRGLRPRTGYNILQGAGERMLTQAIQKEILDFNRRISSNFKG